MIALGTSLVEDVRKAFAMEYERLLKDPETDVTRETVDLQGVSFLADEETIFGRVNQSYVDRELAWYLSQSLNVNDIPGGAPAIWRTVADEDGFINSNYGYLFLGTENGSPDPDQPERELSQFQAVVRELKLYRSSRRATAVYTNPYMHFQSQALGKSDFVCTNAVNYRVTGDAVDCVVQMRSNDAVFGFRNDLAWQRYALKMVGDALDVEARHIVWQAASLHVYPRHQHLLESYITTGEFDLPVTKKEVS